MSTQGVEIEPNFNDNEKENLETNINDNNQVNS